MNEYFFFSIVILVLIIISTLFSIKYQKDFYHFNRSSKFFVIFFAIIITMTSSYFMIIIADIMKFTSAENEVKENYLLTKQTDKKQDINNDYKVLVVISILNIFFYIFIPFVFFYFVEEKISLGEDNSESNTANDQHDNENLLENVRNCDDSNINPSFYQLETSPWNISLVKNYFYYILAYSCLNIAYLIGFKINNLDSAKNLIRYSIMPEELRKVSNFNSDFEIIAYANVGLLITVGKFLLLIYLPYGLGAVLASVIEKLKSKSIAKKEYSRLDNNFTKNYETIKNITSTKLMTGRPLTKKERQTLKTCKQQDAFLQHKQEFLEEKFSTFQKVVFILVLPFKYIFILFSTIITLSFLTSKGWIVYNELSNSICGSQCGFIANTNRARFTLQSIMLYLVDHDKMYSESLLYKALLISILLTFFAYFITSVIVSLYTMGIVNFIPRGKSYSYAEICKESYLKLIFYSICSLMSLVLLVEIFQLIPDISYFYDSYSSCDIYNVGSANCSISLFGLTTTKLFINFIVYKYFDLLFSLLMICLVTMLIFYLPIKTIFKSHREEDERILLNHC